MHAAVGHAYRDEVYHAAVDTNNGVESQNKLLNTSFCLEIQGWPCQDWLWCLMNTSSWTCITSTFLNHQILSTYRPYNSFVPPYLHGRPHQVVIHSLERKSLERKSNCQKYNEEDITIHDMVNGVLAVRGSNGKSHTVDFGKLTNKPSCSCLDWIKWQIPYKHLWPDLGKPSIRDLRVICAMHIFSSSGGNLSKSRPKRVIIVSMN